ncbi:MAG: DUF4129 domain-containing protein [Mycobacterium sp.]|nr:DUF4129 domain-containing protein [Mycobacterium sp.]
MPGDEKAVARTVAVIVALLLAIVALRGYLPDAEPAPTPPDPEPRGPGSVVPTLVMLGVAIIVSGIATVGQARRRRTPKPSESPFDYGGGRSAVPWRLLLIAAGALLVWLVVVLLLARWGSGLLVDSVPTTDPESVDPPRGGPTEIAAPQAPADSGDAGEGDVFGILGAATVALLVLSIVATLVGRRRATMETPVPVRSDALPETPSGVADLARAAELGLAEIGDRSRDPREAIIACYAAMERELGKSPGTTPQDSDTPSEVLARAVERHALHAGSATELVDLFGEARFSSHVMNEAHRAAAVRALRLVQRELQGVT